MTIEFEEVTPKTLAEVAEELRIAARFVEEVVPGILTMEELPEHLMTERKPGASRSGQIKRPTEQAAMHKDWLVVQQNQLLSLVVTFRKDALAVIGRAQKLNEKFRPPAEMIEAEKLTEAPEVEECSEQWCCDSAAPGRGGRCESDYRWLKRHPALSTVPRSVIDARTARREVA